MTDETTTSEQPHDPQGRVDATEAIMFFIEKIDCTGCPCRNIDCENGSNCNLGYEMSVEWADDKELIYCSSACGLEVIRFDGCRSFEPTKKRKVTNLHPSKWDASA